MNKTNYPDLPERTKAFALRVLKLADAMPRTLTGEIIARQIARSGTSTAANYRASQRARSKAEFISKLSITHEEADETCFWLELIEESNTLPADKLGSLKIEANELTAIFVTSLKTAKASK